MDPIRFFELEPHGPDTFVGEGPRYPWGGLFGGQIVAQAFNAAARTVDTGLGVHSLRAYFIRRGDHTEPIRFEVDRIRNGRSFATRRVVARQAIGAILNLEASFQKHEDTADIQVTQLDSNLPGPDDLADDSWLSLFERRAVVRAATAVDGSRGPGRSVAWMRVPTPLGDDPVLHQSWLAFLSDDMPTDSVRAGHPEFSEGVESFNASLDHTIWFHRPFRADEWHLYDFTCHGYVGARGLSIGSVFTREGVHVATVAQEVLVRDQRSKAE